MAFGLADSSVMNKIGKEKRMRDTGYRILADGVTASNDTWATGLANHDLIIGPTGGGKTRGYVLPNLLSSAGVVYRHGHQGHPAAAGGRHPGAAWVPDCWSWTLPTCCARPGGITPCGLSGTTWSVSAGTSRTSSLSPPRWCQSRTKLSHSGSMPRGICWRPLSATRWSAYQRKSMI